MQAGQRRADDPPTPAEGSGAPVQTGERGCIAESSTACGDTSCESGDGGEIIASEVE